MAKKLTPAFAGAAGGAEGPSKMFLDRYGLIEKPFGVTPDPRFLYLRRKHLEALSARLWHGDQSRLSDANCQTGHRKDVTSFPIL